MPNIHIEDYHDHGNAMRYGSIVDEHKGIDHVIGQNKVLYESLIDEFREHIPILSSLPYEKADEVRPYWNNGFMPFLDVLSLFGILGKLKPKRFIEIGSGNSTKVANFARKELGLEFRLISIDPAPRSEIDSLCDEIFRTPLQECDLSIFECLEADDILFFDGSHRVLQNSDNQILFFEIIPRIRNGVVIHIHDINWPNDYPNEWNDRYYNEQYVLGAMLLYAPEMFEVIFPSAYVTSNCQYRDSFQELWERTGFSEIHKHGCSFWFRKIKANKAMELT